LDKNASDALVEMGVRAGQAVLDFGCGSGTYTVPAARLVGEEGRIYALDISTEALDRLEEKVRREGLKNITRIVNEGRRIPLEDNSIDVMLLIDVLQEIDDKDDLFKEAYRILKPSGRVSVYPMHVLAEEDEELKRIREKKLRRLMKQSIGREDEGNDQEPVKPSLDKPVELTDATFLETIANHPNVVVDFWAPWCGPCQMVAPIIEELARQYVGKVLFGKLNVDENPLVAMRYGITSIPTLLFFKNGELIDRVVGAIPKQTLEQKIKRHL